MSKERIISQVGDSTDGEDYEDMEYDVSTLKRYSTKIYSTSSILKDIGSKLLQSTEVREKYKSIKKTFIKEEESQKLKDLDHNTGLGRGWGIIINNYHPISKKLLKDSNMKDYFNANKEKIENFCKSQQYSGKDTDVDKAIYYLEQRIGIQKFQEIHNANKEIELSAQDSRAKAELFAKPAYAQEDASLFLAKVKAIKKLDRDVGKIYLYDYKHGTKARITATSITKKTTQQNETLEVHTGGGFSDYVVNEGDYGSIGTRLKRFINEDYIKEDNLSIFLKASLKGEEYTGIIHNNAKNFTVDLMDRLQALVKLIFGVEVKRNSAALLTNPMFFDLVDAKVYKVENIADEMPMAIKGAVSASVRLDMLNNNKFTYDYRNIPSSQFNIINDKSKYWSQLKLDIDKKIKELDLIDKMKKAKLGNSDTISKLDTLKLPFINIAKCNKANKIDDAEIPFQLGGSWKVILKFKWDSSKSQFAVNISQIQVHNVKELTDKDEKILQDWLEWKLKISEKIKQKDISQKLSELGLNDVIEKLKNLKLNDSNLAFIKTDQCDDNAKINDINTKMTFELSGCKGTFRLEWNITSNKYEVKVCQIQEVKAEAFFDLIKEWYGIDLPYLNKPDLIKLKAAAEPEDPKEDRDYQDNFKVLATDKGELVSETELSEYKQKYVTNHSKAKSALKKVGVNKIVIDEISKEIKKATYHHITSKELVESLGSKFVISSDKPFEETIGILEAIYEVLNKNEEFIGSNRLNLKDKNKHHTEGNVLSIDDLFNEVLNSVNRAAQETHREDILTTLKEYYYDHQEQISTLGESGNIV